MYECTIDELRDSGYAIVLFTPDELEGAAPDRVEESLIEAAWDIIKIHAEQSQEEKRQAALNKLTEAERKLLGLSA